MALVILGGLATSTFVNLLVVPTLYLRFGRHSAPDETRAAVPMPVPAPAPAEPQQA
jgi:hypothetical protein